MRTERLEEARRKREFERELRAAGWSKSEACKEVAKMFKDPAPRFDFGAAKRGAVSAMSGRPLEKFGKPRTASAMGATRRRLATY